MFTPLQTAVAIHDNAPDMSAASRVLDTLARVIVWEDDNAVDVIAPIPDATNHVHDFPWVD